MTNTVGQQPLYASLQLTDYLLGWQAAQSPPTRKITVSALGGYYLSLASGGTVAAKVTISAGGFEVSSGAILQDDTNVTNVFAGHVTMEAFGGWGGNNWGKQLYVTATAASNNPAIAITDLNNDNLWGICNNAGTLQVAAMPAYSDSSTSPTRVITATSSAITLLKPTAIAGTTTNDNAAAGYVGQYVESSVASGSAVSMTTDTPANITSISLTAGDWDVRGTVGFVAGASTSISNILVGASSTSATLPTPPASGTYTGYHVSFLGTFTDASYPFGPGRLSLAATTTIYLVCQTTFSGGTGNAAYGFIGARRVR